MSVFGIEFCEGALEIQRSSTAPARMLSSRPPKPWRSLCLSKPPPNPSTPAKPIHKLDNGFTIKDVCYVVALNNLAYEFVSSLFEIVVT